MRPGNRNTVRIVATGPKGAKAILSIGDTLPEAGAAPVPVDGRLNLEFAP
jgi:hypothetical protein